MTQMESRNPCLCPHMKCEQFSTDHPVGFWLQCRFSHLTGHSPLLNVDRVGIHRPLLVLGRFRTVREWGKH